MILIIDAEGRRLCQDGRWREHADFGTYPECVKEYRVAGFARRRAKRIKGTVIQLPADVTIDRSGDVRGDRGQKRSLTEFTI